MRRARLSSLFAATLGLLAAPAAAQIPLADDDLTEVTDLLESFDDSWAERDLDGLMAPVSAQFGCELYGGVNRELLRETFGILLDALPDSRVSTYILETARRGGYAQAFTCRRFSPVDSPSERLEELCHVYYLTREPAGIRVIGLEEYDHDGYACLEGNRFVQRRFAFSFEVPERMFATPVPESGAALEEIVLRGDRLRSELRVMLIPADRALDLEAAFDADLDDWVRNNRPAKVETRGEAQIGGHPAWDAMVRYSAPSCRLTGTSELEKKRARRVYVAIDPRYLLSFTLHAPRTSFARANQWLDEVMESLQLDLGEGLTFAETVARRNGWGSLDGGFFACPDSGLMIQVPDGFDLALTRTGALLSLQASTGTEAVAFRIDCVPLLDPTVSLDDLISLDDMSRAAPHRGRRAVRVGRHDALQIERTVSRALTDRHERIVYIRSRRHLITVRASGTREEIESAQEALESLLSGISVNE